MSEKMYRGAVIGLGIMGEVADGLGGRSPEWYPPCSHADAYEMHPRVDLVAGATRDPDRQARFREKRGKAVYGDYRQLLEKERPDLVSIATPAMVHVEMVIAAAKAGVKAIWCEKAMAVSLDECDQMIAACEKSGTVLCINHQRRWDDRYQALRRLLQTGEIGKLQAIQISFGRGRLCRGAVTPLIWRCILRRRISPGGWAGSAIPTPLIRAARGCSKRSRGSGSRLMGRWA